MVFLPSDVHWSRQSGGERQVSVTELKEGKAGSLGSGT